MGGTDRSIRIMLAALMVGLYYFNVIEGVLGIVLLVFASIFVLTSFVSFCPLYLPFGINTCKSKKS